MYNVYKNGAKVGTTNDKQYLFTGLEPNTSYRLGVSRVVDGRESEIVTVTGVTEEEPIVEPAFNLVLQEAGDRYLDIKWDCDAPLGTAYFNIYVDDKLHERGFLGRRYTIQMLEPLTDYKITVTGTRDNEETKGVTINAATTAPIGDDEPELPNVEDLSDILNGIGSFESMGEDGLPVGWVGSGSMATHVELVDDWVTHGDKGVKLISNKSDMTPILDHILTLPKGKYISIADYEKPTGWEIEIQGENYNSHDSILSFGETFIQMSDIDKGIMYALLEVEDELETYLSIGGRSLDMEGVETYFYFDAVRVYAVSDELYSYIKAGKMQRERIKEVFPYVDNQLTESDAVMSTQTLGDVSEYHVGGGWYELPNGDRVRGKDIAQESLDVILDE